MIPIALALVAGCGWLAYWGAHLRHRRELAEREAACRVHRLERDGLRRELGDHRRLFTDAADAIARGER